MRVSVQQLQDITNTLCKHLKDSGCCDIDLDAVSYWAISEDDEYDPYRTPSQFTLGDLQEDWAELQRISDGSSTPVGYGFVWLAAILRSVGRNVNC
jgi:hypothetical protein